MTNLRKFILLISLLFGCVYGSRVLACGGPYYTPYERSPFQAAPVRIIDEGEDRPGYDETLEFWYNYLNGAVSRNDIKSFFDKVSLENLPEISDNKFYSHLRNNGDENALNYIADCLILTRLLEEYQGELWDYDAPSTEGIDQFLKRIDKVSTSKAFKPRYEFLKIRAYGGIKNNEGVMKVWNGSGKKMEPSPLRDRMEGYVGGVLYRQGKYIDALDYFTRTGDVNSIRWCVDKLAGAVNLTNLYNKDPNSVAIPYILQDYINYLIAATDAGRTFLPGYKKEDEYTDFYMSAYDNYDNEEDKIDVVDELDQMIALCKRVLQEGKTTDPMMWATALGTLEAIKGYPADALATLENAQSLDGSVYSCSNLDNFLLWVSLLNSGKGDEGNDAKFANRLDSFYKTIYKDTRQKTRDFSKEGRIKRDIYEDNIDSPYSFFTVFFTREGFNHYMQLGQTNRALAVMAMRETLPVLSSYNSDLGSLRDVLDKKINLDKAQSFLGYASGDSSSGAIDRILQPYAAKNENLINDVIGTRLMRAGKFKEALPYLAEVDVNWIHSQPVSPYLYREFWDVDYYPFRRSELKPDPEHYYNTTNPKAFFCAEMIEDIDDYNSSEGDEKALKALNLAARCHFASPLGDGWALSEYKWSSTDGKNELVDMMQSWLGKARNYASSVKTKNLISFATLSIPSGEDMDQYPFNYTRNNNGGVSKYYLDSPTPQQMEALNYIAYHWEETEDQYMVRSCDILRSYMAGNFIAKPNSSW